MARQCLCLARQGPTLAHEAHWLAREFPSLERQSQTLARQPICLAFQCSSLALRPPALAQLEGAATGDDDYASVARPNASAVALRSPTRAPRMRSSVSGRTTHFTDIAPNPVCAIAMATKYDGPGPTQ